MEVVNMYYAIKVGRDVKDIIVSSWEECKKYTYKFNSIFKKFTSEEKAKKWLETFPEAEVKRRLANQPLYAEKRRKEKEFKFKLKQEKLKQHRLYLKNKRKEELCDIAGQNGRSRYQLQSTSQPVHKEHVMKEEEKTLSVTDIMEFLNKKYNSNLSESSTRNLLNSFDITCSSNKESSLIIRGSNYIRFKEEVKEFLTKKINTLILENFENILKTKELLKEAEVLATDPIFYVRKFKIPSIVVEAVFSKEKIFKNYLNPSIAEFVKVNLEIVNDIYEEPKEEQMKNCDMFDNTPEPEKTIFKKLNDERIAEEEPIKKEEPKLTKEEAVTLIEKNPYFIEYLEDYQDDEEVVKQAIKNNGSLLRFASNRLKDDKNIVLTAIQNTAFSYKYASNRLKSLPEIYYTALYLIPDTYKFLPTNLKKKKEILVYFITNKIAKEDTCFLFNFKGEAEEFKETLILNLPLDLTKEEKETNEELKVLIDALIEQKKKEYKDELKRFSNEIGKTDEDKNKRAWIK